MTDAAAIQANIRRLREQGAADATLIAVSKTFPAAAVRAAAAAGARDIGENYLQEAEEKIRACADLPLTWHFIGRLQKNKTARIAALFDWVHSVDRLQFAERLSAARAADVAPLNVFLQVNISDEENKAGVAAPQAAALAARIAALPRLRLRGLMILPAAARDGAGQYEVFQRAARLQQNINQTAGLKLDCLSMGMSGDYQQALAAGATHVRLGSAIFGARAVKTGAAQ